MSKKEINKLHSITNISKTQVQDSSREISPRRPNLRYLLRKALILEQMPRLPL